MAISVALVLLFHFATLSSSASMHYAAVLLFGPARTFQWACYFHMLSQPKRYSPAFSGRLVGYGNTIIAIVGNGPPTVLHAFVSDATAFGSVANRYLATHVSLMILIACCVALPIHLHRTMGQS